ncbi:MAG: DUF58 domain-containing protein [Planctomycetales bacterium]|nr:DUF58 domain-containing protein [Planctomycetales bacterium]
MTSPLETAQYLFELLRARPIPTLVLLALPFVLLALVGRIYPSRLAVRLSIVPCLIALALIFRRDLAPLIITFDLVVLAVWIVDLFTLPRRGVLSAERHCKRIVSLQKNHPISLTINNRGTRKVIAEVRDDIPQEFTAHPDEFYTELPPRSRAVLNYELQATRRGAFVMEKVHLRIRSRFGMWQAFRDCRVESTLHVYPDMQQLSKYAILARTNRLSLMGVRRTRRVGTDNEFERLRDYSLDDNYKHIDWRSTARRNKLTVKDFQTSQSQRLIFLIDCGRMMTNHASGISLLDHSLNAMLMLSYVALRQGDSVGMISFADRVLSFVPPKSGMNQMNQLIHASFDRFPTLVESRYDLAFLHLSSHCQKRSMVVLVTNVIDEVNAHQIHQYLGTLVGRHLPLGVLLRDRELFDEADRQPRNDEELFRSAAAAEILNWRHQVLCDLEHRGVLSVDVFPEDMTAPLVNKYLEVKARHLL